MAKMVKRRKWKSASERNGAGRWRGGGVIHKVVSHAEMHLYLRYRSLTAAICDRSAVSIKIVTRGEEYFYTCN